MYRILIADDHAIVLEGLCSLLSQESDFSILATAQDGREAVYQSRQLRPDLVITDLSMPNLNGIDAARQIKKTQPEMIILCLSMHTEEKLIAAAISAGISGYVLKDCAVQELIQAIRIVLANHVYISPAITSVIVEGYKESLKTLPSTVFTSLTPREREIVQLIAEGDSIKTIAGKLCLSVKTISTHRENAMRKLQIDNLADLVKYAIRAGLTSISTSNPT